MIFFEGFLGIFGGFWKEKVYLNVKTHLKEDFVCNTA
jgi:hypothetical protein